MLQFVQNGLILLLLILRYTVMMVVSNIEKEHISGTECHHEPQG